MKIKRISTLFAAICIAMGMLFLWMGGTAGQAHPESTIYIQGVMEQDQIQPLLDDFTSETGIDVVYDRIDNSLNLRSCSGTECPEFAIIPWPGLIDELCISGRLVDLYDFIDTTTLEANFSQTWIEFGEVGERLCGVPVNAGNKSLVWYDPGEFSSHGWLTPTTWTEMIALSDVISDTGTAPWSIGAESGSASGWPLTDWFENILLRSAGPEIYDSLVLHTIPWTSTEVMDSIGYYGQIFGEEAFQLGGKEGTIHTNFIDAIYPPFEDPPEAYMHAQGNFVQYFLNNLPQTPGVDYDIFPFPEITTVYTQVVMGAGDLGIMYHDNPDTRALIDYLISTQAAEVWVSAGNISPNRNVNFDLYSEVTTRAAAEAMANAEIFRFDLSDLVPNELNLYLWDRLQDLVYASPNPAAMYAIMADIEAYASQFQQVVEPGTTTTFNYTSGDGQQTTIVIPAGAVTETTLIQHIPQDNVPPSDSYHFTGRAFSLSAYRNGEPLAGLEFTNPPTVTLTYSDEGMPAEVELALELFTWNGSGWTRDGITMLERDTANNRVTATFSHLSDFALFGPYQGYVTVKGRADAYSVQTLLDTFSSQTYISAQYEQMTTDESIINCAGTECPDMAILPQPGLVVDLCGTGKALDMSSMIDTTTLEANFNDTWIAFGTFGEKLCGLPLSAANKGNIWYDPSAFDAQGWLTPTTWTEMIALSEIISDTGTAPWSIGAESGEASGWPLTDWFENILLRDAGPEVYDALILHTIPWTSTEVLETVGYFGQIFGEEAYQYGGKSGTLNTFFFDAVNPLYEDPPGAYMHAQGGFVQGLIESLNPGEEPGVGYGHFPFPQIDPAYANAIMGAGDLVIMLRDTDEAQELADYLITTEAAEAWVSAGNISPNRNLDLNLYEDPLRRERANQLVNTDIFRFDLSDLVPYELNLYLWQRFQDLVIAAPDPVAMYDIMADIEAYASQYQQAVDPGLETVIHYIGDSGEETIITVPAGAVTETISLRHIPGIDVNESGILQFAGRSFALVAYRGNEMLPSLSFDPPLTVTVTYDDTGMDPYVEETLMLYTWDGNAWTTQGIALVERDLEYNTLTVTVSHITDFALFGGESRIHLPLVVR